MEGREERAAKLYEDAQARANCKSRKKSLNSGSNPKNLCACASYSGALWKKSHDLVGD